MTLEKIGNTDLYLIKSEQINPHKDTIPIFIKLEGAVDARYEENNNA